MGMANSVNLMLDRSGADRARGLVTGWAAISTNANGDYIKDSDGDIITIEALEGFAARAMVEGQAKLMVGKNHIEKNRGIIVESMVVDKEKRAALGFGEGVGGWAVTLKITDRKLFDEILNGDMPELSIFAKGQKDESGNFSKLESQVDETLSVVDRGASGDEQNRPAIVLAKRSENGMTLEEVLAGMSEEDRKVVMDAIAAGAQEPDGDGTEPVTKVDGLTTDEEKKKEDETELAKRGDLIDVVKRLETTNADLARKIQQVETERSIELLSKRASVDMKNIPTLSYEQMGECLQAIEDNIPNVIAKRLVGALTAASAALGTTFGVEPIGSEQRGESDAYGKLQAVAKRLRKDDTSLTAAQAMERAIKENSNIYNEAK